MLEWDDPDLCANLLERGTFLGMQRFRGVVATFDVDRRANTTEKFRRALLWKDCDVIHCAERGEDLRAIVLVVERATSAFQSANGGITIEAHSECIAETPGCFEVPNMSDVEQIEAAIGNYKPLTACTEGLRESRELIELHDLRSHGSGARKFNARGSTSKSAA